MCILNIYGLIITSLREAITNKIFSAKMSSIEDGIIAAPLVYRLSGLGPRSRSSKTVRVCSLNHFEAFLLMKQMPKSNKPNENDVTNATIFSLPAVSQKQSKPQRDSRSWK